MYFKDLNLTGAKLLNPDRHENPKYLLNNKIYRRFDDSILMFIIKYYLDGFKKYYNNFELHSDFIIRDFTPGQTSASVKNIQNLSLIFSSVLGMVISSTLMIFSMQQILSGIYLLMKKLHVGYC